MNRNGSIIGILLVVVGVVALLGIVFAGSYNSFVKLSQEVDKQYAVVESKLQRRYDLIPNLVETVKGYIAHEQEVFGQIAEARAKMAGGATSDERLEGMNQMESAFSRLLVIMENYPDLKAQQSVNNLMVELAGTENRISVERDTYNGVVEKYNTKVKSFPAVLMASMFGYDERPYFKANPSAGEAPKITFP